MAGSHAALLKRLSATIQRPNNTTAYAAGDVLSEVTTNNYHQLSGAVKGKGAMSGRIKGASVIGSANQGTKPDLELWIFKDAIAEVADNAAFAPTDAEMLTLLAIIAIPVASFKVGNAGAGADGNIAQFVNQLDIPYRLDSDSDGVLHCQVVVRNAYTPVADEQITVNLDVELD